MMRRVALLVSLMLAVGGCAPRGTPAASDRSGAFALTWGEAAEPSSINPLKLGDAYSWDIFSLIYEPLTQPNADLTVGPGLAETWKQTSRTSWRFRLRDGVEFSNGRTLTAADVAGTWAALKNAGVRLSSFPGIESMTAAGRLAFDVHLTEAVPDLPNLLESFLLLPAKEMTSGSFDPDKDLLGTGPFASGDHVRGVSWTLQANPHYWKKGLPRPNRVTIKFIPDDASRLAAVRTGAVDFAMTANPDVDTILKHDPRLKVVTQGTTDMYYLMLNPNLPKLSDERVRQAINLAIDRKQIIDTALGGIGRLTAVTPRAFPEACDPGGPLGAGKRNVDQAKALLQEAGVNGTLGLRLTVVPALGAALTPRIAQVIQANLREIGIAVKVSVIGAGPWLDDTFTKGTYEATVNWFTGGGTASQIVSRLDPQKAPIMAKAVSHDPATLQLVEHALAAPTGPTRTQAFAEVCAKLNELAFFVPLATKPTLIVYRSDRISPAFNPTEPVQMTYRRVAEFAQVSGRAH